MKKTTWLTLVLMAILACSLNACVTCHEDPHPEQASYLPLAIGNYWKMKAPHYTHVDKTIIQTREIVDKEIIDGKVYFVMRTTMPIDEILRESFSYYRIDGHQFVYVKSERNAPELNTFRLHAQEGDSWNPGDESGVESWHMYGISDLIINDTTIENTKNFAFDIPRMVDEEHGTYLAPNLGFVKEYGAWGLGAVLVEAKINEVIYKF